MKMHFDAATVMRLLTHARTAPTRAPTMEQTFDGTCRHDGNDVDVAVAAKGRWPTADDVDPAKLPVGLWLVGDQGVYLMSPGRPALCEEGASGNLVARSEETDPRFAPDRWYDNKVTAFGGDDGVVFLSAEFIERALQLVREERFALTVTPQRIGTAVPAARRHAARAGT